MIQSFFDEMPRLNSKGEYGAGVGGSIVSVNGLPLARGGGTRWWDDDTLLANACSTLTGAEDFALRAFDRLADWKNRVVDPRGFSSMGAGGGNYVASLETKNGTQTWGRYRGEPLSSEFEKHHALDGHRDGSLAVASPDYRSLIVLWGNGARDEYQIGDHWYTGETRIFDGGVLYVMDPRKIWIQPVIGSRIEAKTIGDPYQPVCFFSKGVLWVMYHSDKTYLHPFDEFLGHSFPAGEAPDILVNNGMARVVIAGDEAESPELIAAFDWFDLETNKIDLTPPPTPVKPPIVAPLPRKIRAGYYFKTGDRYGDNPSAPGNCEIAIYDDSGYDRATLPLVWVSTYPDTRGEVVYYDAPRWPDPLPTIPAGKLYGQQLYCDPSESLPDFWMRCRRECDRFESRHIPFATIDQAFDRNGEEKDIVKLQNMQLVWPELARIYVYLQLIAWFNYARQNKTMGGTKFHPELEPYHRATVSAIPSGPPPDPEPPHPHPSGFPVERLYEVKR